MRIVINTKRTSDFKWGTASKAQVNAARKAYKVYESEITWTEFRKAYKSVFNQQINANRSIALERKAMKLSLKYMAGTGSVDGNVDNLTMGIRAKNPFTKLTQKQYRALSKKLDYYGRIDVKDLSVLQVKNLFDEGILDEASVSKDLTTGVMVIDNLAGATNAIDYNSLEGELVITPVLRDSNAMMANQIIAKGEVPEAIAAFQKKKHRTQRDYDNLFQASDAFTTERWKQKAVKKYDMNDPGLAAFLRNIQDIKR